MSGIDSSIVLHSLAKLTHTTPARAWVNRVGVVHRGKGEVILFDRPDPLGINQNLAEAIILLAEFHGLVIEVDWMTLGHHVTHSRHYRSQAFDSDFIYPVGGPKEAVSVDNVSAVKVVATLLAAGWHIGEQPDFPGLLLGPVRTHFNPTASPHAHHLHASNAD